MGCARCGLAVGRKLSRWQLTFRRIPFGAGLYRAAVVASFPPRCNRGKPCTIWYRASSSEKPVRLWTPRVRGDDGWLGRLRATGSPKVGRPIVRGPPAGGRSTASGFNSLVVGELRICRLCVQVGAGVKGGTTRRWDSFRVRDHPPGIGKQPSDAGPSTSEEAHRAREEQSNSLRLPLVWCYSEHAFCGGLADPRGTACIPRRGLVCSS